MDSTHHISTAGQRFSSESDLEFLIAKYTLEYLYQWTNHFDAAQLAQIKQILDGEGDSKLLLQMAGLRASVPS
jgi:hypothetical protein